MLSDSGNIENGDKNDVSSIEATKEVAASSSSDAKPEETERRARVEAVWEQMNKGVSSKTVQSLSKKRPSAANKTSQKTSNNWMTVLGLAPKKIGSLANNKPQHMPSTDENGTNDETKKLAAAAALSAVKDATAASISGKGKIEITEVRDFAGQDIEMKKFVDADSREASEKARAAGAPPSAVDAILEQIKKKQKLSVLDKTKKDWGEYKENKGVEEELDAYKKSSNQYLDKVSFLQRADYREFERERDARLALQSRRKTDMREDQD